LFFICISSYLPFIYLPTNVCQIQPIDKYDKYNRYPEIIALGLTSNSDFDSARPEKDSNNNIAGKDYREYENQPAQRVHLYAGFKMEMTH